MGNIVPQQIACFQPPVRIKYLEYPIPPKHQHSTHLLVVIVLSVVGRWTATRYRYRWCFAMIFRGSVACAPGLGYPSRPFCGYRYRVIYSYRWHKALFRLFSGLYSVESHDTHTRLAAARFYKTQLVRREVYHLHHQLAPRFLSRCRAPSRTATLTLCTRGAHGRIQKSIECRCDDWPQCLTVRVFRRDCG